MFFLYFELDSKEAEAAASAYNTPYNQGGPQAPGPSDLPPSYNVSRLLNIELFSAFNVHINFLITLQNLPPSYNDASKKYQ